MEKLHRKAILIHQHPEGALPHLAERRMGQRAALFVLYGRRVGYLLQIVPEHTPPQPYGNGRETPHRHIQRRCQHRAVYRLRQCGGDTEKIVPVAPLGSGIYLGRVVQTHPPQAPGRGQVLRHKAVDLIDILLHVLLQAIEHIGVPAPRRDDQPAFAPGLFQPFMQSPGVIQQYLIAAGEDQRRRKARQVAQQGRTQRVRGVLCIAPGVELQQLLRQGRIVVPVEFVGLPGTGQVHPGRDGDEPAGQLPAQLLQPQAQGADQPAAGALAAQQDLLRRVALFQQIVVGSQCILQRGGIGVLWCQAVRPAEHAHTALAGQRSRKALGIVQTAAGIAAAVEIQHHAAAALVLRHDPRALELLEVVVAEDHLPLVQGAHQLAQLILSLAGGLQ